MRRTNRRTAYQREKEPIQFSTSSKDPLAAWRISGIKGPVFEQWYFDSVAADSKSGITMIFARDASYAMLGQGHLRMEFDITFPDGKHFNHADWMSEAALEETDCDVIGEVNGTRSGDGRNYNKKNAGQIKGVWTGPRKTYTHTIAADGSSARVDLDGPEIQGWYTLTSTAPPHYPQGESHPVRVSGEGASNGHASTQICPKIHYVEVIPTAVFEADLVVQGRPLRFKGIGGHVHIWAAGSWFDTVRGWRVCRAVVGPWSVTCNEFTSQEDGKTYTSGYVARDGRKEFGALVKRGSVESSAGDPKENEHQGGTVVKWKPTYETGIAGPFQDKSTGCILHLKSGEDGEEWRFELAHKHVAFDVAFGGGDSGLTGFLSGASGGKVGEQVYSGVGNTNVNVLPRECSAHESIPPLTLRPMLMIRHRGLEKNLLFHMYALVQTLSWIYQHSGQQYLSMKQRLWQGSREASMMLNRCCASALNWCRKLSMRMTAGKGQYRVIKYVHNRKLENCNDEIEDFYNVCFGLVCLWGLMS